MKWSKSMGCLVALCGAVASCTSSTYYKEAILPERPMVYPMSVKLMDVNWVNQELCRIPLLIEETRQGNRITKVRVEPTGDIRFPGMGEFNDKACRWTVEACDAERVDAPYTLRLRLSLMKYSGHSEQQLIKGGVKKIFDYGVASGSEWDAVIEVRRSSDSTFTMHIEHDNISKLKDVEAHQYMNNPGCFQQTLDLQLQLCDD